MILRTASGRQIILPNMHAIELSRQAKVGAIVHDQPPCGAGAPARVCRRNSRACSSITRALPDLLRYCSSVHPPAANSSTYAMR